MKIHQFDSTGEAYNASQSDETVKPGDLLLIKPEKVLGVAFTWPIAVTATSGELHRVRPGSTIEKVVQDWPGMAEAVIRGYYFAVAGAINSGWRLNLDVDYEYIEQRNQEEMERFASRNYGDCKRPI